MKVRSFRLLDPHVLESNIKKKKTGINLNKSLTYIQKLYDAVVTPKTLAILLTNHN